MRGWYHRGYIPHFDGGEIPQFITFRLADSLPQNLMARWRCDLESGALTDAAFRRRIELCLDENHGAKHLQNPEIANLVQDTLLKFHGEKYRLSAWVVMPNHVHFLATPQSGYSLSQIMHTIKSFTAHQANKIRGASGRFWFPEYFDRYIRNQEHFETTCNYIENNPVKAGLCDKPADWRFSSADWNNDWSAGVPPACEK